MTFSQSDLPHIRWSLLTFLVVLGVGASAVYLSQKIADAALRNKNASQQQLSEARNKLNAARDDRDNLSTYAAEYEAWVKHKVIGDEQRLDLIEGLEALRKKERVVDFKYTIAPQAPYTPLPALNSGNFELKQSTMTLQLQLLHEEQLIRFFNSLRSDIKGWFMLDHCAMERATDSAVSSAQLKAECSGSWITIKNRNAK
jgi:hypothetical protein